MADEDVRHAERNFINSNDYINYCRYVAELRRHLAVPYFESAQGAAHGWIPSAVHLFAPWNATRMPLFWDSRRSPVNDPCIPGRGILGWVMNAFFTHLMYLSPRRCTCGGEERGHAPNCEIETGTGDFSEEFHSVMRQWFSYTSQPNLLDRYLAEGWRGVHDTIAADEYSVTDLMNVLNARLGWHYVMMVNVLPPEALDWGGLIPQANVTLNFILQDWGPSNVEQLHPLAARTTAEGPWSSFEFHLNSNDQCEIQWKVAQGATDPTRFGSVYMGIAAGLSSALAERISNIPTLLAEYQVWREGFYPVAGT